MDYTKCVFEFSEDNEIYGDVLASILGDIGFNSFEYQDGILSGYIATSKYDESNVISIIGSFPIPGIDIKFKTYIMANHDWNESWESSFSPIRVGNLAYIHSSAYPKCEDVRHDILINPRMAFGSGSHSTTRLVLRLLLTNDIQNKSVLDLGCGTGILGIAACLAGCRTLTAMDIDPDSISNTQDNMRLNRIDSFTAIEGSIDVLPDSTRFDIILSNIHLNVHLSLMNEYFIHLSDKGELYLSGFYKEDTDILISEAESKGFKYTDMLEENGWVAIKLVN